MRFEQLLRASLPEGFTLPDEIWALINWLEAQGQFYRYRVTKDPFMPTVPVKDMDALWSNLAFVIEPDMVRYWFGKDEPTKVIVPLVRCGGDGSHLAIWKDKGVDRFVFMGSEGDVFHITNDPRKFILLLTMGYTYLEGRYSFDLPPAEAHAEYFDDIWPDPIAIKEHIQSLYGLSYPRTGAELLSDYDPDPFLDYVQAQLG